MESKNKTIAKFKIFKLTVEKFIEQPIEKLKINLNRKYISKEFNLYCEEVQILRKKRQLIYHIKIDQKNGIIFYLKKNIY